MAGTHRTGQGLHKEGMPARDRNGKVFQAEGPGEAKALRSE